MARLLRKQISDLMEQKNQLEEEINEWRKIGDCIMKFYHWKAILKYLKETKYFLLMTIYKTTQAQEEMKKKLDETLFGEIK